MCDPVTEADPELPQAAADVPVGYTPYAEARAPHVVPAHGPIWLVSFVCLLIAANVGTILMSRLVDSNPGALLALSSRNRHLVLTVPSDLGWPAWAAIGGARIALSAIVCHLLGRAYGDLALRWFWRYLGMPPEQVTKFETGFAKAEWFVVPFFVGSNIVWVLSGAAKTTWKRLLPMAILGIAGRLVVLWWLARQFESQLRSVIDFTTDYQLYFIIGGIAVVALTQVRNFRSGR